MDMRRFLAILLLLCACDTGDRSGTLGLPTSVPTASRSAGATPTATGRPSATAPSTTPPPSPSPSGSASASPSGAPTQTQAGTPTANPNDVTAPYVVSMSATQQTLTVVFSEPMRSRLTCGATGAATGPFGTIDNQATSPYHSADRALDETLQTATQATIGSDCSSATLVFGISAAAGTFAVTVASVQDLSGNTIDPTRNAGQVTIRDEGPPIVLRAVASGDSISVTFSEPMLQIGEGSGVTMFGNYRLDGNPAPITNITCTDGGCRGVRLSLTPGSIVPGRTYSLRVANVVDRSGVALRPDPTTLSIVGRAP
jgi:hypothetical protein